MHPLYTEHLAALRHEELRREAADWRVGRSLASAWDHPWRRGLGEQLEHWGLRLQGGSHQHGPASPPAG